MWVSVMLFCKICGDYIYGASRYQQYCPTCRRRLRHAPKTKAKVISQRQREVSKRHQRDDRLNRFLSEAAQCGMSYGTYRAAVERFGKSFEELKAK